MGSFFNSIKRIWAWLSYCWIAKFSSMKWPVYILLAYTVTVLAFKIPGIVSKAKVFMCGNKHLNRYITYAYFRAQVNLYASLFVNLGYAAFQMVASVMYSSFWYGAVAIYYMVVSGVRFLLLHNFKKSDDEKIKQLETYRFCGGLLFALNVAVTGVVVQMVRNEQLVRYPGILIYVMAVYAFYRTIISIIKIAKHRNLHNPILSATKSLNFTTALMAMFSLEVAMIAEFGGIGGIDGRFKAVSGMAVCFIIFATAFYMIIRANIELKKLRFNFIET